MSVTERETSSHTTPEGGVFVITGMDSGMGARYASTQQTPVTSPDRHDASLPVALETLTGTIEPDRPQPVTSAELSTTADKKVMGLMGELQHGYRVLSEGLQRDATEMGAVLRTIQDVPTTAEDAAGSPEKIRNGLNGAQGFMEVLDKRILLLETADAALASVEASQFYNADVAADGQAVAAGRKASVDLAELNNQTAKRRRDLEAKHDAKRRRLQDHESRVEKTSMQLSTFGVPAFVAVCKDIRDNEADLSGYKVKRDTTSAKIQTQRNIRDAAQSDLDQSTDKYSALSTSNLDDATKKERKNEIDGTLLKSAQTLEAAKTVIEHEESELKKLDALIDTSNAAITQQDDRRLNFLANLKVEFEKLGVTIDEEHLSLIKAKARTMPESEWRQFVATKQEDTTGEDSESNSQAEEVIVFSTDEQYVAAEAALTLMLRTPEMLSLEEQTRMIKLIPAVFKQRVENIAAARAELSVAYETDRREIEATNASRVDEIDREKLESINGALVAAHGAKEFVRGEILKRRGEVRGEIEALRIAQATTLVHVQQIAAGEPELHAKAVTARDSKVNLDRLDATINIEAKKLAAERTRLAAMGATTTQDGSDYAQIVRHGVDGAASQVEALHAAKTTALQNDREAAASRHGDELGGLGVLTDSRVKLLGEFTDHVIQVESLGIGTIETVAREIGDHHQMLANVIESQPASLADELGRALLDAENARKLEAEKAEERRQTIQNKLALSTGLPHVIEVAKAGVVNVGRKVLTVLGNGVEAYGDAVREYGEGIYKYPMM